MALRPFWFIFFVLAVAAVAGGFYAAAWPGFYAHTVRITGNRIVPAGQIGARAQIATHTNVWLQDMAAAAARVRAIPYIDAVRIHRSLPAHVTIAVTERVPSAVLQGNGSRVFVDSALRVLQAATGDSALPVIYARVPLPAPGAFVRDADVQRLRNDAARLAQAHVIVRSVQYDTYGDLIAVMSGGVRLLLGDDADLAQKSTLVAPILSQLSAQGRRIAAIDLRAPKTPVVQYR
ncbi:MAG: cell division protein FtsQ/DivIB [Candidatus Baltobacteraceae bacterium]